MHLSWKFSPEGPNVPDLRGPFPLVRRHINVSKEAGLYLVTCGDCLAHVGTSSNIRRRLGQLAYLRTHRGSAEVLCAAYCTKMEPLVWYNEDDEIVARKREKEFKEYYGEPPCPSSKYNASCKNGQRLRDALVIAAGRDSWEAGYIEATFAVGEMMNTLFDGTKFHTHFPRRDFAAIERIWERVGQPPGPWSNTKSE